MLKTKWWLGIVGSFYVFLAGTSLWVLFINPQLFGTMFPFAADSLSIRAFSDAWLIFVLEMAGARHINAVCVQRTSAEWSSRNDCGNLGVASQSWAAENYIPFLIVHVIIAVTGIYFLRKESVVSA